MSVPDWDSIPVVELTAPPSLWDAQSSEFFHGQALILPTDQGQIVLQLTDQGVRLASAGQRAALFEYGLLRRRPKGEALEFFQDDATTMVRSGTTHVVIEHQPFALSFYVDGELRLQTATDGHFVRRFRVPPLARTEEGWWLSFALQSNEPIYGLGEKWGSLNKRGELIRSFNHDALGVNAEISYKNTPFAWSPLGWGVFTHTGSAVTHAVGHSAWSQRSYCALVEDDCFDTFVFLTNPQSENRSAELIENYTELTGRAPMPPRWSNGVILSKAYYRTADEILAVGTEVRDKQMPCDVITFDGRAWQDTDTRFAFEWDASRYPDPAKVINQLKAQNFKICVWEYPLISNQHPWFDEFAEKGWLLIDQTTNKPAEYVWDRGPFGEVLTPLPTSGLVDFTHPDAYEFWCQAHQPLFDLGVDMIKADFGEQLEANMVGHNGESGAALHNVYAFLYNQCVFEAAERYSKEDPFLFSRAAWVGSQRLNSHWGGDPQADWEGMISNIRGGLSWGLSGSPFYATDVGGFYKDTRDNSLYVRWAQAAIFSAHFRLHGIGPREPWSYSPAAETAVMQALQLRYQLLAYLEHAQRQAHESGIPVQRPMVLSFPKERCAWAFENQFMFGDDLLVAPCFAPNNEVTFYLPEGEWSHFSPARQTTLPTKLVGGKTHTLKLALDEIAVFARDGAAIPLCKDVTYTAQHGDDLVIDSVWTTS